MIDIPLGKALVAVDLSGVANKCFFCEPNECISGTFACDADERKDGKNVIFKLVDWPESRKEEV